jgi:MFS transporter, Spinster family, sphingosine-1-phosphate transporter
VFLWPASRALAPAWDSLGPVIKSRSAILALLTGLNLVNYIDRFLVMAVGRRFQADLDLSNGELGTVETAFMIGYMLTSPIFGRLGDRRPRKNLIAAGVLVWSIATVLSGTTHGMLAMVAARVAVGVGEASYATLAPTIIDDLFERDAKERALTVFYAAIPVGAALGYKLGGYLEPNFGWRSAFFICGGPGVLLAALTLLIAEPSRTATQAAPAAASSVYTGLYANRQYRYAVIGYVAQTFALGGFTAWAAAFLSWRPRPLCLELAAGNSAFGSITVITGLLGTALGGVIASRVPGADRAAASLKVCAWSSAAAAPLALAALLMPSSNGFFLALGAAELAIFASVSPINAAVLLSVPPAIRASAMAASIFTIHLLGDLISAPAIGYISDAFHDSHEDCSGGRGLLFGMYLLPAALALSAAFWFRGAAERGAPAVLSPPPPGTA